MISQNVNYSVLAAWKPRTETATYTNSTGSAVTLTLGTLMGRIVSSNLVTAQASGNSDGSQVPIGVLFATVTIPANSSATVVLLISGDVNYGQLIFNGSDTLATTVSVGGNIVGTINDCLVARQILPIVTTDLTFYDN